MALKNHISIDEEPNNDELSSHFNNSLRSLSPKKDKNSLSLKKNS